MTQRATQRTSLSPDAQRIWRAARGPVIIGVIMVAAALVIALLRGGGDDGPADPESVSPAGSRALARLLQAQGVEVVRVDSLAAARQNIKSDTTLLITQPNWLTGQQLTALRGEAATVVAIGAYGDALAALAPSVRKDGDVSPDSREPGCAFNAAGTARLGGVTYSGPSRCYEGTLVQSGTVTLLGDATPLTNEWLDEDGNAALSMRVLGKHHRLVWYLPSLSDTEPGGSADGDGETGGGREKSFYELIPQGWWFGLGQAGVAVLLFMVWRARRLGPIVTEPLPVVVRAAETTEGRARLYRRARATDHAADALRAATIGRLIPLLGLSADATPTAIVDGVTARTGRPGAPVHAVLFGPPPNTEQALVQLADELDTLADEVGSH
nr:FIG00512629: secreted protein [Kibdelosporangium sp. MJ126-NF4]